MADVREIRDAAHFRCLVRNATWEERVEIRELQAPEDLWHEILDSDPVFFDKIQVGLMKTLPPSVVRRFAEEDDWMVRLHAVSRDEVPEDVLRKLAADWNFTIRSHVASHPNTPRDVLEVMASEDDHWRIRDFAQRNLAGENLRERTVTRL